MSTIIRSYGRDPWTNDSVEIIKRKKKSFIYKITNVLFVASKTQSSIGFFEFTLLSM